MVVGVEEVERKTVVEHLAGDYAQREDIAFRREGRCVDRVVGFRRAVGHCESWHEVLVADLRMVRLPEID